MAEHILKRPARLAQLEVMRTVCFAAVVSQHLLGAYAARAGLSHVEAVVLSLLFGLCKFAVPAFVFVSGAVLFRNYYGQLDYGAFLKKRLGAVILPYLLWAAAYYVYGYLANGAPVCGKLAYLQRIVTFSVSYHTWYVGLILQFYLLLPLIFWLFRALSRAARTRRGLIVTIGAVALGYALLVTFAGVWKDVPVLGRFLYTLRAQNSLYYLIYFLLGGLLGLYPEEFGRFVRRFCPAIAVAAAVCYGYVQWRFCRAGFAQNAPPLGAMGSLTVPMFLLTTACILLLYRLCLTPRGRALRVCVFVGRHSFAAYLAHVMVLNEGARIARHIAPNLGRPVLFLALAVWTLFGSLLLGWLFDAAYGRVRHVFRRGKKTGS